MYIIKSTKKCMILTNSHQNHAFSLLNVQIVLFCTLYGICVFLAFFFNCALILYKSRFHVNISFRHVKPSIFIRSHAFPTPISCESPHLQTFTSKSNPPNHVTYTQISISHEIPHKTFMWNSNLFSFHMNQSSQISCDILPKTSFTWFPLKIHHVNHPKSHKSHFSRTPNNSRSS